MYSHENLAILDFTRLLFFIFLRCLNPLKFEKYIFAKIWIQVSHLNYPKMIILKKVTTLFDWTLFEHGYLARITLKF